MDRMKEPKTQEEERNYTYILECGDGSLYTGWTNNLERRLKAHNEGKGAKYTKTRRPLRLKYYEIFPTKEEAMSREYAIKRMTRKQKEELCRKERVRQTVPDKENGTPQDHLI